MESGQEIVHVVNVALSLAEFFARGWLSNVGHYCVHLSRDMDKTMSVGESKETSEYLLLISWTDELSLAVLRNGRRGGTNLIGAL